MNHQRRLRRPEFEDLVVSSGLGMDKAIIDKVFYIFDDNNLGSVDFKEVLVGIEVFRQNKFRSLINCMIEIADIEGKGKCTEPLVSQVFTAICFKPDEKVRIKNISRYQ